MNGLELRSKFLKFFEGHGHQVVESSSLVPDNDPTLLFTNAGMNQFKDCFLGGEKRDYTRAATSQKCLRISGKHNDLENVGVTARHHTFFEMLGNFSFGDYFKEQAIEYAWNFIIEELKLPREKLWVTVYKDDDDAADIWHRVAKVPRERILKFGEKDNFWSMGETGPCGPCTEIFYFLGDDVSSQSETAFRESTDGSYMEIWNNVFMQFDRSKDGKLVPLPKPSIDTGMGLERISAVVQGHRANYDSDLLRGIISRCEEMSGYKYDGRSYEEKDLRLDIAYARDVAMRVIADHSRSIAFLLADGVVPSSDGRGYVLRRIIRRAVRHGRALGFKEPFLARVIDKVIKIMCDPYQELTERRDVIERFVNSEEKKFQETLDAGLTVLSGEIEKVGSSKLLSGKAAFLLHDTYGFPLDLTQDALKPHKIAVNEAEFDSEMEKQRSRSRADRKSQGIVFSTRSTDVPPTNFLGYEKLSAESTVLSLTESNGNYCIITNDTPFYAESGGQVGDTGMIIIGECSFRVKDTQKEKGDVFVHHANLLSGEASQDLVGKKAELIVDALRRHRIMVHHSVTHLVHAGLRKILGDHVKQAGSRVDDRSSRFDYSHFEPVTSEDLIKIADFVNKEIQNNYPVATKVLPIEEAKKTGAVALFGEKYGASVRVIQMGPNSIEFCGGTHVDRVGSIGLCLISSESGVAAGVRRIECCAGQSAMSVIAAERGKIQRISEILKSDPSQVVSKVEKSLERIRVLERELEHAKARISQSSKSSLLNGMKTTNSGIKVVTANVDVLDIDTLKMMVDDIRNEIKSGVVVLGAVLQGNGLIVCGVTKDLTAKISAGSIVKEVSALGGGKGGGRPDFGQAGGVDPSKIEIILGKVFEMVNN